MNLIYDNFLPVRRKSGREERIAPWRITETEDPALALSAPRPDFNGALLQFLIGLLQTAAMPENETQWLDWMENPPKPEDLKNRFGKYAEAFETEGARGVFMQDFDPLEDEEEEEIFHLLIDSPGEKTIKESKDLFIKRDRAEKLCEPCAITALFTLQLSAPSGGQGHRTSLRGGGPLTALAVLDTKSDGSDELLFWRNLWLNVLDRGRFEGSHDQSKNQIHDIFPWMAETRTSEKKTGKTTAPGKRQPSANVLGHCRGGIRIQWDSSESGVCDLCGSSAPRLIKSYKTKNYGIDYEAWRHHLSPYYYKKDKKKTELLPRHIKEGDVSYQHWLDCVEETKNGRPAKVISRYRGLAKRWKDQFRLRAFGYEMDNMKARCYYEKTFPLFMTSDDIRECFSKRVSDMTKASSLFAGYFSQAIKDAWFREKSDKRKKTPPSLKKMFYQRTEKDFFGLLQELPGKIKAKEGREILHKWHGILKTSALNLFGYWAEKGGY